MKQSLVLLLFCSACTVHHSSLDGDPAQRSVVLGPLFDASDSPERREMAIHPLFRAVRDDDVAEIQIVDPLVQLRKTAELDEWRFLSLMWFRHFHPRDAASEWDFMVFPFIWAGGGPPGENYFAVLPFLGTIRNFAGFEDVFIFLFPLYYRLSRDILGEEHFHNITPLIGWVNGGPRDGSWRVLPLYGHWRWEGKFDKYSVLWPLFHYQRNRQDTESPSTLIALWPFFKVDQSDKHRFLTFLWPFLRWNVEHAEEIDFATGERTRTEYFRRDFLNPLFRHEKTRDYERLRLWPFFSTYRSEDIDSDAFAVPLYWKRTHRIAGREKKTVDLVPLWHHETTEHSNGLPDERSWRLWPLAAWEDDGRGGTEFQFPALLPLDVDRYAGEFEENWGPWWQLFQWQTHADGSYRIRALLRFFEYEEGPTASRWNLPLIYGGESRDGRTDHRALGGLIQWGHGRGGWALKLFFLPILSPEGSSS